MIVNRSELESALSRATRFSGGVLNSLQEIGMAPSGEATEIEATNLSAFIRLRVPGTAEPGDVPFSANAKDLLRMVRVMSGEDAKITASDTQLDVTCGSSRFKMALGVYDDRPQWPSEEAAPLYQFSIRSDVFRNALALCLKAVNVSDHRPFIKTVHIGMNGQSLVFEATDGAQAIMVTPGITPTKKPNVMLPHEMAGLLVQVLPKTEDSILVSGNNDRIYVRHESECLMAFSLYSGTYPDLQNVLPRDRTILASFDRNALLASMSRADAATSEMKVGWCKIEVVGNTAEIVAQDKNTGREIVDEIEADAPKPISVHFRPDQVRNVLSVFTSERVALLGEGPLAPVIFRGSDDADSHIESLAMPVRIKEEDNADN